MDIIHRFTAPDNKEYWFDVSTLNNHQMPMFDMTCLITNQSFIMNIHTEYYKFNDKFGMTLRVKLDEFGSVAESTEIMIDTEKLKEALYDSHKKSKAFYESDFIQQIKRQLIDSMTDDLLKEHGICFSKEKILYGEGFVKYGEDIVGVIESIQILASENLSSSRLKLHGVYAQVELSEKKKPTIEFTTSTGVKISADNVDTLALIQKEKYFSSYDLLTKGLVTCTQSEPVTNEIVHTMLHPQDSHYDELKKKLTPPKDELINLDDRLGSLF